MGIRAQSSQGRDRSRPAALPSHSNVFRKHPPGRRFQSGLWVKTCMLLISPDTNLTCREATEALFALTNPSGEIASMFSNGLTRSRRTRSR